tara:strand:- start:453 stop:878 length:426 start_codon:yes stop_codon:yes gene_type:complete
VTSNWSWSTAHKTTGSGIIVVKKINQSWKPLGLWAYGGFDIPKGHVEQGDDIFQTALREMTEEAGISKVDFKWGTEYIRIDNLFVYLASTNENPKIHFNKEENLYEHEYAKWTDWTEMKHYCYDYLVPAIEWAETKVCSYK